MPLRQCQLANKRISANVGPCLEEIAGGPDNGVKLWPIRKGDPSMKRLYWGLLLTAGCGTAPAVTPAGLPPIDAEVPKHIETATLALG
jgi:hypothetical protein